MYARGKWMADALDERTFEMCMFRRWMRGNGEVEL